MTREEAIATLYEWQNMMVRNGVPLDNSKVQALRVAIEALSERTGEWIKDGQFWICSECGTRIFSESYMDRQIYHAFCGRCGAKMVKGGEDE